MKNKNNVNDNEPVEERYPVDNEEYNPYSQEVSNRQDPNYQPKRKIKILWGRSVLLSVGLTIVVNFLIFGHIFPFN